MEDGGGEGDNPTKASFAEINRILVLGNFLDSDRTKPVQAPLVPSKGKDLTPLLYITMSHEGSGES